MRKLFSAATSLVMAATMVGAVAPVVVGAADAKRSISFLTYKDATLPEGVTADGATVSVSADAVKGGDVVIPVGIYITATEPDIVSLGVDATVKSDNADVSKIKFKANNPTKATPYFSSAQTFKKADGSDVSTDKVVTMAGSYSNRTGFLAHGAYSVASAESQTAAGTDNAFVGCVWTNGGSKYSEYFGAKSDDFPLLVFDVTLPKGISEGEYVIDFCNYMTKYGNPSCILESTTKYETYNNKNLDLNTLTIKVGDAQSQSTTTTTGNSTTTTTTTTTATSNGGNSTTTTTGKNPGTATTGEVVFDLTNPDSEDGYWRVDPDDGVVYVDLRIKTENATIKPTGFSCIAEIESNLPLTIEKTSPALACNLSTNPDINGFSGICQGEDGYGTVVKDNEGVAAYFTVDVPAGTPDGLYQITLTRADVNKVDPADIKKEAFYTVGVIPGYIAIGDVTNKSTTTTTEASKSTTTTTASSTTTTTTTTAKPGTKLYGDTNCDGVVRINDVVLLNKWLNDNNSYAIEEQGKINADCYKPKDGKELTAEDSDAIIKSIVHLVTLPVE